MKPNKGTISTVYRVIGASITQSCEVSVVNNTRLILTIEDRQLKAIHQGVTLTGALNEVVYLLINQPVSPNVVRDLFYGSTVCYQL